MFEAILYEVWSYSYKVQGNFAQTSKGNLVKLCMKFVPGSWRGIHTAFKYTNSRLALNLCCMIRSWLVPWFKARLRAAELTMGLHLHSCLIWIDAIWNVVCNILSCPCQLLLFVCITDHLTVGTTTVCPSKLCLTCQCSSVTYMMAIRGAWFNRLRHLIDCLPWIDWGGNVQSINCATVSVT